MHSVLIRDILLPKDPVCLSYVVNAELEKLTLNRYNALVEHA